MGLRTAVFWFLFVLSLTILWWILDLPPEHELIEIVSGYLKEYGLWLLLVSSFIEALLFIGFYFPGSLVIFLGVALAADITQATVAVVVVSVGMAAGYTVNYLLGKYGWYRLFLHLGMSDSIDSAQYQLLRHDTRYIFYTFWNPGLAAVTATAAGTLRSPRWRFARRASVAIMTWNTFWGVLVYTLGYDSLRLLDFRLILSLIAAWILFEVGLWCWKKYS